jgi:hypothetical protein
MTTVSQYVLQYIAMGYYNNYWKKDQINTEIHLHDEVALQFVNKVSHDVVRGALKCFISLCEREVIQRIYGF